MACVAQRTRRGKDLLLQRLIRESSGGREEKMASGSGASLMSKQGQRTRRSGLMGRRRKGRRMEKRVGESDVVVLDESSCEEEGKGGSVSCSEGTSGSAEEKMASGFGSSSKSKLGQRTRRSSLMGRRRKGRRLEKRVGESDFVFLGECVDEEEWGSVSCSRRRRGLFMGPRPVEVIEIDESDDNGTEEELKPSEKGLEYAINVDKDGQNEKAKESYHFADKVENFDNVGCGCGPVKVEHEELSSANPVIIDLDGDSEIGVAESSSEFDSDDCLSSSTDSEDDESSDEDFLVDEIEGSSSEDGSTSYDDDEKEEEIYEADEEDGSGSKKACGKRKKNSTELQTKKVARFHEETFVRESRPMVEEQGREVETESSGICRKINGDSNDHGAVQEFHGEEKASETVSSTSLGRKDKQVEEKELENTPSSVKNDEYGEKGKGEDQKEWKDAGYASMSSGELKMKGYSTKLYEVEAKKQEMNKVVKTEDSFSADVEVFDDYQESLGCSKPSEDEAKKDKKKQVGTGGEINFDIFSGDAKRLENEYSWRGHHNVSLHKEVGDSAKIVKRMDNEKERGDNKETEKNDANANDSAHKRKEHPDKGTSVRSVSSLLKNQEKIGDSAKVVKIMEHEKEREANKEKKAQVNKENDHKFGEHKVRRMPARPKELHLIELLAECFWGKRNAIKDDLNGLEEKGDDVHQQDTEPTDCGVTLPMKFTFGVKKAEPVEKSESEKELDMLWVEMESLLRFEEIGSLVGNAGTNEAGRFCKHDFYLDEEIGIYCKFCSWIATEIKYVSLPVEENFPLGGSGKRISSDGVNVSLFDEAQLNASGGGSDTVFSHNEGTVWDIIPDIKESMYPHQQEGFEFIWKNLAGTIDLHTLKSAGPCSAGGCIISHAPGTGKTRLTIVFLQTYLEVFPKCQPVIIAPASLLLTWEDEFKKWDIGIPFHNLNNVELSGKEHVTAINKVDWSTNPNQNKGSIRMVKLYSWLKEKSILGISYHLYEKLAGVRSKVDEKTEKKNRNMRKEKKYARMQENNESGVMGKVLRDSPGLLVLDEGHTPRNQRSLIWKVLSEIQTEKRIILSGTPFQNNFLELYNTLCLVKPSFPDRIPQELKKFCQGRLMLGKKASEGVTWDPVTSASTTGNPADEKIHQLKLLMDPFVHVHKGSILRKNLPGLRDCVVTLKPDYMQKALLQSIEGSQNTLVFEHKMALVSIHPSLFLRCSLSKKEESIVDRDQLEELKLNPYGGVKTKFLVEFVRLCEAVKEKVLVFSQFIDPLCLIIDQLKSVFNWSEGKEVLYMHGKLDQKQRQSLIHGFNDANSQAKILLASTKACSEGINLIGASRVILLDVVWNPSVERQAISRAYRLGQKRVVYTYHLITQGTTECTKYCKQAEKDRLSELVFSARNAENDKQKSSAVVSEDKVLDQMVWHDKLKDMFGDSRVQPKERDLFESFGS